MAKSAEVPTLTELQSILSRIEEDGKQHYLSLVRRDTRIKRLTAEHSEEESIARALSYERDEVKERIFVLTALTPADVNARDILIAKLRRSQSDRIIVAALKSLRAEIVSYRAKFRELCRHPFVFSYDGHKSYSSWEDSTSGNRVCTWCNLREISKGAPEDIYGILAGDGTRMIRRDLRRDEDIPKSFEEEWFTPEFLQQLFDASAGSNNVRWPAFVGPASVLKVKGY